MASTGKGGFESTAAEGLPNTARNLSVARHLKVLRQEAIFTDGALPARVKALAAVLWSVSARCEPCIEAYMRKARELGATPQESGEMLAIASAMGGCVGETWAHKALATSASDARTEACCER